MLMRLFTANVFQAIIQILQISSADLPIKNGYEYLNKCFITFVPHAQTVSTSLMHGLVHTLTQEEAIENSSFFILMTN